jgi:hypothetical protein
MIARSIGMPAKAAAIAENRFVQSRPVRVKIRTLPPVASLRVASWGGMNPGISGKVCVPKILNPTIVVMKSDGRPLDS